jgi:hypothetical protein
MKGTMGTCSCSHMWKVPGEGKGETENEIERAREGKRIYRIDLS